MRLPDLSSTRTLWCLRGLFRCILTANVLAGCGCCNVHPYCYNTSLLQRRRKLVNFSLKSNLPNFFAKTDKQTLIEGTLVAEYFENIHATSYLFSSRRDFPYALFHRLLHWQNAVFLSLARVISAIFYHHNMP